MSRLPGKRYWHHLTGPDFDGLDVERTVAVLPVGAIEQHGPHLPVWVDAKINEGIVSRAAELAPRKNQRSAPWAAPQVSSDCAAEQTQTSPGSH